MIEKLKQMKIGHVERFGVKRFQGSDEDIQFYVGLYHLIVFLSAFRTSTSIFTIPSK